MKHDIFHQLKKKPLEFIVLAIILFVGLLSFFFFRFNTEYQRYIIYFTSLAYFLWSIFHHYKRNDLHLSIVIEYLVLIAFACLIATGTFF